MEKHTYKNSGEQLIRIFSHIKDPRVKGRCRYSLIEVIVIAVCAICCGAKHWKQIAEFGRQRESWFRQYIDLPNGVPSHLTICRILALIPPGELMDCFMEWSRFRNPLLPDDIIAIDGKTLRKSGHAAAARKPLHLINAYAVRQGVTLGAVKTPDKSNEIKGIPPLLNALNIAGCVITIDAMGTQKGIANLIKLRKADYVLSLKKNHKKLYRKVTGLFATAHDLKYQAMVYKEHKNLNYDHSRYETREYTLLPMMYLPFEKKTWQGLQTFIQVRSTRYDYNKKEEQCRVFYYISSIHLKKYLLIAKAIRQHWHVENKLHWKLDVAMQEDACRVYHPKAAENFSTLRKLVLQLLEKEKSVQNGIAGKQWQAVLNPKYLKKVVGF